MNAQAQKFLNEITVHMNNRSCYFSGSMYSWGSEEEVESWDDHAAPIFDADTFISAIEYAIGGEYSDVFSIAASAHPFADYEDAAEQILLLMQCDSLWTQSEIDAVLKPANNAE